MPVEAQKLILGAITEHPQVPDLDLAVVRASHDEVACFLVPIADVHVLLVGANLHGGLVVAVHSHVDDLEGAVGGAWVRDEVHDAKAKG